MIDAPIENETDQPRTPRQAGGFILSRDEDKDAPRLPLPTDDEIPGETVAVLAQARDALVRLVGAVFQAATEIVGALLRFIQTVAGREVAEEVDRRVADTLDPLVPNSLGALRKAPETGAKTPSDEVPVPDKASSASGDDRAALREGVRDVLETYARTNEEREALSPAFVEMVTTGAQFLLSVERQFPGAIDALQASDRAEAAEPPAEARPKAATPDRPSSEPAVIAA